MAAIFGAVASGAGLASLAIQLGDSAVKLKRFCNSVRDAPEDLQYLILDIETLGLTLDRIERMQQQRPMDPAIITRCLTMCRQSTKLIGDIAEELDQSTQKRKLLGSVRTALKQHRLEELCLKLERAKSSLGLAFQLYNESLRTHDHEMHIQMQNSASQMLASHTRLLNEHTQAFASLSDAVSALPIVAHSHVSTTTFASRSATVTTVVTAQLPETGDIEPAYTRLPTSIARRQRQSQPRYRLRLGVWFTKRTWEIALAQAQSGWDVRLRTWNLRPWDSKIFNLCQKGDLRGVQRLMAAGEASVYDVTDWSDTPLTCAVRSGSLELCRYLIDEGGALKDPSHIPVNVYWARVLEHLKSAQMYRLFDEQGWLEMELEIKDIQYTWYTCAPNAECLSIWQQSLLVPYASKPLEERFAHAMVLQGHASIGRVLQALGGPQYVQAAASLIDDQYGNLLHALANALPGRGRYREHEAELELWRSVLRDVVQGDVALHVHNRDGWPGTPLMTLLEGLLRLDLGSTAQASLQLWAEELLNAGVNLVQYGESELALWEALKEEKKPNSGGRGFTGQNYVSSFSYGPEPTKWRLHVRRRLKVYIYEPQRPPGAWVSSHYLPQMVCWRPRMHEIQDGYWRTGKEALLYSDHTYDPDDQVDELTRMLHLERNEAHSDRSQDDCSKVARLTRALRKWRRVRGEGELCGSRRSRSTSPPGARRWRERYGATSPISDRNVFGPTPTYDDDDDVNGRYVEQHTRQAMAYEELCWGASWNVIQWDEREKSGMWTVDGSHLMQ